MTQNGATPEQLNALSKPVPAKYIKTDDKGNSFVTARFIMNLLDSTVEKANWKDTYRLIVIGETAVVECTLYIKINGEWVGKADVGGPAKTFSPEKSLYSSALKRAAFRWGIARELYGEGNYYVQPDADTGETMEDARELYGEGNYYVQPDADTGETMEDAPNRIVVSGGEVIIPEGATSIANALDEHFAPRDVDREMGVAEDDNPFAADTAKFSQSSAASMKHYMVDNGISDHVNHAGNTIAEAMQEMYTASTWPEIYTYAVKVVWAAVTANRAAKAAEGEG